MIEPVPLMTLRQRYLLLGLAGLLIVGLVAGGAAWLQQSNQPHSVTLTWNPPRPVTGIRIVNYNVYRRSSEGTEFIKIAIGVAGSPYEDRMVSSGRTYSYVVTSVDQMGRESRFSEPAQAKIP